MTAETNENLVEGQEFSQVSVEEFQRINKLAAPKLRARVTSISNDPVETRKIDFQLIKNPDYVSN